MKTEKLNTFLEVKQLTDRDLQQYIPPASSTSMSPVVTNPSGILRELTLDSNDNLVIKGATIGEVELAPVLAGAPLVWTRKVSPALSGVALTDVIFGNGVFVTYYGNSGQVSPLYTSTDGITWSAISVPTSINKIVLLNGTFFCLGAGNNGVITSSNGTTWVVRTNITYSGINGIAYGNGVYVVTIYFEWYDNVHLVLTSPDGITWTPRNVPNNDSPDGEEWYSYTSIIFTSGKFYATTDNGYRISSTNGINWVEEGYVGAPSVPSTFPTVPSPPTSGDLRYLNGFYILSANSGVLYISANGTSWTKVYYPYISGAFASYYGGYGSSDAYYNLKIAYGNGTYVGVNSVPAPDTAFNLIVSQTSASVVQTFINVTGYSSQTIDGDYKVATFLNSATATITGSGTADVLLVGGGGAGVVEECYTGGSAGGGGGQVLYVTGIALTAGSYPVVVGAGGLNQVICTDIYSEANGTFSTFKGLTAYGGGGPSDWVNPAPMGSFGGAGGGWDTLVSTEPIIVGGGGIYRYETVISNGTVFGETISIPNGNMGGKTKTSHVFRYGNYYQTTIRSAGGGGGAGSAGTDGYGGTATTGSINYGYGGNGGNGISNSITGTAVIYGGGGGAGASAGERIDGSGNYSGPFYGPAGTGGTGGGGNGGSGAAPGASGTNGLGGGGGGSNSAGGNGGSGVVIIRYKFQ